MQPPTASGPIAFTTRAPELTDAEACALALERFGIVGQVKRLTSERDLNFHLQPPEGDGFVLKISNASEAEAVTDFQNRALQHLAARDPGLPVQRLVPGLDGNPMPRVRVGGETGTLCTVRLLSYLPGIPQHLTPNSAAQRTDLGRCLARLDLALAGFAHPAQDEPLLWDLQHAAGLRSRLPFIADDELRAQATGCLDRFEAGILPRLPALRRQVVHNDFNPHNIVVDPEDHGRIAGILDFGDMVAAPLVFDLAVAASYQFSASAGEAERSVTQVLELTRAYHAVLPLLPLEAELLFDLVALRHAMTVTITEWRASLYPANRNYILRNHPRAAAGLAQLAGMDRSILQRRARAACALEPLA